MKYDMIVIGGGSAGLNMSIFGVKAGLKVLLIDRKEQTIGGDCLNFGCVPSKALIHVSRLIKESKDAQGFGYTAKGKVDMKKVAHYIKSKQDVIRKHENSSYLKGLGMDVEIGKAVFVGKNTIKINGMTHSAKRIVLATGSSPRKLQIPGVEKVPFLTNETIFQNTTLPKKFLVIGGGPIGIELGQAYARLGAEVTVLESGSQFLPKEAPQMAKVLHDQLVKEGMNIRYNMKTKSFPTKNSLLVENEKGTVETIKFDQVLISIGRVLNIEGLDIEKAGIEKDDSGRRLKVNKYLQTTNKSVYVCGDVAGNFQFTHAAEVHASVLIHNFIYPWKKKLNLNHMAWVTYTDPEIASFGLWEKELQKRKIPYKKIETSFKEDDRAIVNETTEGKLELYVSKNAKILGGTMVGKNAGELIQELILANTLGVKIPTLYEKVYPYPTATRVNRAALLTHMLEKFTPLNKKLIQLFYRYF